MNKQTLAEKIIKPKGQINQILCPMLPASDVKEFIKDILEFVECSEDCHEDFIREKAGKELI